MSWLKRLQLKADNFIPADAASWDTGYMPRSSYPFGMSIQGLDSNVVMSPVNWIMTNFTEAEPVVESRRGAMWKEVDHAATVLLQQPNTFYDGDTLFKATLISHLLDGNAYWLKVRNRFGEVLGYWYLPHFLVEPKRPDDGSVFLSHYEYRPQATGERIVIPPRNMVHLRFGIDPRNTLKGLSKLKPLLREVFTDEEASNFAAAILRNMGVPGGVIAPKSSDALPSPDDVREMKAYMKEAFTGDKRGEWLVLGTPTETSQFGFNPQNLMLGNLRDIAEERVCAALGVPAAIVGFGSGLQSTKVGATMRELRRMAWVDCIMPLQRSLAKQMTRQIMPDFVAQTSRFRIRFDISTVAAFQEEKTEEARRHVLLVGAGIERVDRAQEALGLEVDESQAVYLRPTASAPIAVGDDGILPGETDPSADPNDDAIPSAIAARLNGNGATAGD